MVLAVINMEIVLRFAKGLNMSISFEQAQTVLTEHAVLKPECNKRAMRFTKYLLVHVENIVRNKKKFRCSYVEWLLCPDR